MLEKILPHAMLKAGPNLESRIRTLKKDWAIVYDMLSGKDNSSFGWDEHRQLVVAKDAVWHSYISMDVLATQSQPLRPNQDDSTCSKKKKNISDVSDQISSTSLIEVVKLLGENITVGIETSKSISSKVLIQQKSEM
ncbi:hypothetical protein Godav_011578, partial [Gossypium davidsonii]|nr:hypothetical protein [Gossypium davidsonii]MBA0645885.1 hypothetical protein [Gossypium klotzschianum]